MPLDFTVSMLFAHEAEIAGLSYPEPAPTEVDRSGKFPAGQPDGAALVDEGTPNTVKAMAPVARVAKPSFAIALRVTNFINWPFRN